MNGFSIDSGIVSYFLSRCGDLDLSQQHEGQACHAETRAEVDSDANSTKEWHSLVVSNLQLVIASRRTQYTMSSPSMPLRHLEL